MSLFKNTASQKVRVFAFDATTGLPKTGDAANITASISKDFGAFADLTDTSATEEDSTKAKGYYLFDISQTETNADDIAITGRSSTSNIVVVGAPARVATRPPNAGALSIDSSGRVDVIKINGTSQTARDIGASVLLSSGTGTGQLDFTSGVVKSNLGQINGTSVAGTGTQVAAAFSTFFNVATPTGTVNSLPAAAPGASGGVVIAGSNAATTFASWTCTGTFTVSDGVSVSRSTNNSAGVTIAGKGTGDGLDVSGGANGVGAKFTGGSSSGAGIRVVGQNDDAIFISATQGYSLNSSGQNGGFYVGSGNGVGIEVYAGTDGLKVSAGTTTTGAAFRLISDATTDTVVTTKGAATPGTLSTVLGANAITASSLASGAVTSAKFAAGAITSTVIAADAIGASQIAADAVGSSELAASAVREIVAGLSRVEYGYAHVYYVSAATGNDANDGLSPDGAFLTLAAAKSAASSGDLVVVLDGTFAERNLFKTGVDWYWHYNSGVTYSGSATGGLWDDSANGANGAVTCRVMGHGKFTYGTSSTAGLRSVLMLTDSASRVVFRCESLRQTGATGGAYVVNAIHHTDGYLDAEAGEDVRCDNADAVQLFGAAGSFFRLRAKRIYTPAAAEALNPNNSGEAFVYADQIISDLGNAVSSCGISTNICHVEARSISAGAAAVIFAPVNPTARLHVQGAMVRGNYGVDVLTGSEGELALDDCDIQATGTNLHGVYVEGAGNCTVRFNGGSIRGNGTGKDLFNQGVTLVVNGVDYRRSATSGTITEAPPADRVTTALPDAIAGAAGGIFIAGSNAATTANITGNITGNLSGSVGSVTGAVGSVTGNVGGNVAGSVASVTAGVALTSGERNSVADALLGRNISGGSSTGRTVSQALHRIRNKVSVNGTVLTVTDVDDSTTSWTATLTTDATLDPVSTVDPA